MQYSNLRDALQAKYAAAATLRRETPLATESASVFLILGFHKRVNWVETAADETALLICTVAMRGLLHARDRCLSKTVAPWHIYTCCLISSRVDDTCSHKHVHCT